MQEHAVSDRPCFCHATCRTCPKRRDGSFGWRENRSFVDSRLRKPFLNRSFSHQIRERAKTPLVASGGWSLKGCFKFAVLDCDSTASQTTRRAVPAVCKVASRVFWVVHSVLICGASKMMEANRYTDDKIGGLDPFLNSKYERHKSAVDANKDSAVDGRPVGGCVTEEELHAITSANCRPILAKATVFPAKQSVTVDRLVGNVNDVQ